MLDDGDDRASCRWSSRRRPKGTSLHEAHDLGTQTNLLARLRQSGGIGPIDDKLVYLAKLFDEELHIVVRADSGLTDIEQLKGRTISLGEPGSGTQLIAHDVLDRLGIAVREVNLAGADAIERMATGEIDAVALIGGKPIPALAQRSGLRLLAVPFAKPLREEFLPAALTGDDYPDLVEPGRRVNTVAVGTVLIAYNWAKDSDQYRKIRKFVAAFFPQIGKLQAPPHHRNGARSTWRRRCRLARFARPRPGSPSTRTARRWRASARSSMRSCARAAPGPARPRTTRSCFRNFCNGARRARGADGTRDGGTVGEQATREHA